MFVWGKGRGENMLDGGAHFYETYCTFDNKYMAVGAIEPQFYNELLQKLNFRSENICFILLGGIVMWISFISVFYKEIICVLVLMNYHTCPVWVVLL